jgi:hypothetical protein
MFSVYHVKSHFIHSSLLKCNRCYYNCNSNVTVQKVTQDLRLSVRHLSKLCYNILFTHTAHHISEIIFRIFFLSDYNLKISPLIVIQVYFHRY